MASHGSSPLSAAATALLDRSSRGRLRVGVGAAVVLVLVGLAVAVLMTALAPRGESTSIAAVPAASALPATSIYVHLLGAVASPGLYELSEGARAVDAVAAAGGFTEEADRGAVNLARFVSDGEQIAVPVVGAAPESLGGAGSPGDGRVNINTAAAGELETLPRIGPATAARIIDWRETNGRFSTVDDLLAVSGIGEKTLAGFRDLVTV